MNEDDRPATDEGVTGDPDWQAKQPLDEPDDERAAYIEQPLKQPGYSSGIGDVLYAWQMRVDDGWNIIGMNLPNGRFMPLVTTSMVVAWEAFEVAQAHANRNQCQVRLATFKFETLAAVVEPNE